MSEKKVLNKHWFTKARIWIWNTSVLPQNHDTGQVFNFCPTSVQIYPLASYVRIAKKLLPHSITHHNAQNGAGAQN